MGDKTLWVRAVMDAIVRRMAEGTIYQLIYRRPPSPQQESNDIRSCYEWLTKLEESAAQLMQKDEVADTDPYMENKGLHELPKESVEETKHDDALADVADEHDSEEDMDPEMVKPLHDKLERWGEQVVCVGLLNGINWLHRLPDTPENENALKSIFESGMRYCRDFTNSLLQPWNLCEWPLKPRVWLAEMERTLYVMKKRGELPYCLVHPNDQHISDDAATAADGFTDPEEKVLDTLVHALRLWRYCDASKASRVVCQSGNEYSHRASCSSTGPMKLRGNIVQAMSRNFQQTGSQVPACKCKNYDPYWYYWTKDVGRWPVWVLAEERPTKKTCWRAPEELAFKWG